ncbi:hypothetical protein PVAP13_7NG295948 [Panicum virgatum]|uniref:Uncharacterized protein n=1 Tax=Panicum virgatum TaxID=38727 RepID=A0A8T0Q019_PANVG|nr:hypothetical protein PVAP13_7NG295948 [Panicum virgatum]
MSTQYTNWLDLRSFELDLNWRWQAHCSQCRTPFRTQSARWSCVPGQDWLMCRPTSFSSSSSTHGSPIECGARGSNIVDPPARGSALPLPWLRGRRCLADRGGSRAGEAARGRSMEIRDLANAEARRQGKKRTKRSSGRGGAGVGGRARARPRPGHPAPGQRPWQRVASEARFWPGPVRCRCRR